MPRTLKGLIFLSVFILPGLAAPCFAETAPSPRERILFNDDWRFSQGDPSGLDEALSYTNTPANDMSFAQTSLDDSGWRKLNLPHDWSVEGPVRQEYAGETAKLKYWGPVWYRKHFQIPAGDSARNIFLDIDGAMSGSEVWLNGHYVRGWPYGYTSFELNLSPFIKPAGENILAIRLDTPPRRIAGYTGGAASIATSGWSKPRRRTLPIPAFLSQPGRPEIPRAR